MALDGQPRVRQIDVRDRGLGPTVVGGSADVAGTAVCGRLDVADQVVVGQWQRRQGDEERRQDQPVDEPLPGPALCHV